MFAKNPCFILKQKPPELIKKNSGCSIFKDAANPPAFD
jgi:hypothetical protein